MKMLPYLFPFCFAGIWIAACFIQSRRGWNRFPASFIHPDTFNGEWLGIFSGRINGIGYKNSLSLRCNEQGLYMRPLLIVRLFHRPVLIPWQHLRMSGETSWFGIRRYGLYFSGTIKMDIYLSAANAKTIGRYLEANTKAL